MADGDLQNSAEFNLSFHFRKQDRFFFGKTLVIKQAIDIHREHWCCMGLDMQNRFSEKEMSKIERHFDNTDDHLYHANVVLVFTQSIYACIGSALCKNFQLVCFCFFYERLE